MEEIGGKYLIERPLGQGAEGTVYLVRHKDLNIKLALKVLESNFSADPELVEAFKREAEVLFRFSHEGCVQLRDFGSLPDGGYFMATDYCEGGTLRDILQKNGRLEVKYAVSMLVKVLDVLEAAHKIGIIHRDIKPDNVIIERDFQGEDVVKVLDFGVAHLLELEVANSGQEESFGIAGTPQYMSPEQAVGERDLDGRADIYSVGIMAYELLAGKRPFDHDDIVQVLCMHVTQEVTPFHSGFFVPAAVEEVIFKSLSKDKSERFQTAGQFRDALLAALEKGEQPLETVESEDSSDIQDVEEKTAESSNPKVLILDDDENLLNIFTHIFTHAGFKVFAATDVTRIHSYLFMNSVDILITDVNMPNIKGTKVCQLLRQGFPELKIILFSNEPEKELKKLARESSADGFLSKQLPPADWLEYINSLLSQ